MIKIQIQIPDELFHRAKEISAQKEISFSELVRRGLEYMAATHTLRVDKEWCLPEPLKGRLRAGVDHKRVRDLILEDQDERLCRGVSLDS